MKKDENLCLNKKDKILNKKIAPKNNFPSQVTLIFPP